MEITFRTPAPVKSTPTSYPTQPTGRGMVLGAKKGTNDMLESLTTEMGYTSQPVAPVPTENPIPAPTYTQTTNIPKQGYDKTLLIVIEFK